MLLRFLAASILLPFPCEREKNIQTGAHAVKALGYQRSSENVHSPYPSKIYIHKGCSEPQFLLIFASSVDFTGTDLPGTSCENQHPGCLYLKDKNLLLNYSVIRSVCVYTYSLWKSATFSSTILLPSFTHFSIYMMYYFYMSISLHGYMHMLKTKLMGKRELLQVSTSTME